MQGESVEQNRADLTELFRNILLKADVIFPLFAAVLLMGPCGFICYYILSDPANSPRDAVIRLANDVLLTFILFELPWTVTRFPEKQKVTSDPFFAICIIAAIRRIPLIEPQPSFLEHMSAEKAERDQPECLGGHYSDIRLHPVCQGAET